MNDTVLSTSGMVESRTSSEVSTTASYSTSYLLSLFAGFLVGEIRSPNPMRLQKYFNLYSGNPEELLQDYEDPAKTVPSVIAKIPIKIASIIVDENGYCASFITQARGKDLNVKSDNSSNHTLGLAVDDGILAFATFNSSVYRDLAAGATVEIEWRIRVYDLYNNEES